MRAARRHNRHNRGTAMLIVVVLLVVGAVLVASAAVGGAREEHLTTQRLATLRAFYAAEAGMNLAMRELMLNQDEDDDGAVGSISDDANDANDPTLSGARLVVSLTPGVGTQTVISEGRSAAAKRYIEVIVE